MYIYSHGMTGFLDGNELVPLIRELYDDRRSVRMSPITGESGKNMTDRIRTAAEIWV